MESHIYQLEPRGLLKILMTPVLSLLLFPLLYYGGAALSIWPEPRPTFDTDQTILVHQAEASRRPQGGELICVGDSSCLMDISGRQLSEELEHPVLNLGTLSLLGLQEMGEIVEQYLTANPQRVRAILLLLHPEALRRSAPDARYVRFLHSFYDGTDWCEAKTLGESILCQIGLEKFRARVVSRWVPSALSGSYGIAYGFSHDLERYMTAHHGSLVEPTREKFRGSAEYWLAPKLEPASVAFRRVIPSRVQLLIGLTPIPRSYALPDYSVTYAEMLKQWGGWIRADVTLTNLPPTMDDAYFARVTHLNASGMKAYSHVVAEQLHALKLFVPPP